MNSNIKIVTSIIVVVLVLGGLFFWGRFKAPARSPAAAPNPSQTNLSSVLTTSESDFDFGTVSIKAGNASHNYKIKNTSDKPLTITKIYTSCMCTTATLVRGGPATSSGRIGPFGMPGHGIIPKISESFAPGEEAQVEVVFDPAAHGPSGVGRIYRIVYLETKEGSPLELRFTAEVIP